MAELCRKHSIQESTFYKWNKEFLEGGKKRLSGDLTREATSDEVADLLKENLTLKETLADFFFAMILKKSLHALEYAKNSNDICN
jgi:transposase